MLFNPEKAMQPLGQPIPHAAHPSWRAIESTGYKRSPTSLPPSRPPLGREDKESQSLSERPYTGKTSPTPLSLPLSASLSLAHLRFLLTHSHRIHQLRNSVTASPQTTKY